MGTSGLLPPGVVTDMLPRALGDGLCKGRWLVPLGCVPRSGVVGHTVALMNILKNPQTVCQRGRDALESPARRPASPRRPALFPAAAAAPLASSSACRMAPGAEHPSMCFLASHVSSWEKSRFFAHF